MFPKELHASQGSGKNVGSDYNIGHLWMVCCLRDGQGEAGNGPAYGRRWQLWVTSLEGLRIVSRHVH